MDIIRQELLVKGDKGVKRLSVVFDSGATRSFVRNDVANELCTPKKLLIPREFIVADGNKIIREFFCDLVVEIEGREIGVEAFLVDNLPVPMIFGAPNMEAYRIRLNLARGGLDLSEFTGSMYTL
jgi:predicted aspartyl protease